MLCMRSREGFKPSPAAEATLLKQYRQKLRQEQRMQSLRDKQAAEKRQAILERESRLAPE